MSGAIPCASAAEPISADAALANATMARRRFANSIAIHSLVAGSRGTPPTCGRETRGWHSLRKMSISEIILEESWALMRTLDLIVLRTFVAVVESGTLAAA